MKITFTGTHLGMTVQQRTTVLVVVRDLLSQGEYTHGIHGCCEKADRDFHDIAWSLMLARELHPGTEDQRLWAVDHMDTQRDTVFPVPINAVHPQLLRNHTMVDRGDVLVAAPRQSHEIQRSGTWATIRYARGQGRKIYICWPNGTRTIERDGRHV